MRTASFRRLAAAAFIGVAGTALAHSGATGVVKERMDGMKEMSHAVKALGAARAGAIAFSPDVIRRAAAALARHAEEGKTLFPEGSLDHPSEALPSIWTDRAGFDRIFDDLVEASAALDAAADDEAAALTAADAVAATCKACHAKYREKKL